MTRSEKRFAKKCKKLWKKRTKALEKSAKRASIAFSVAAEEIRSFVAKKQAEQAADTPKEEGGSNDVHNG